MSIAFYEWSITAPDVKQRLLRRAQADIDSVITDIRPIIDDVAARGDDALRDYAAKFEGATLTDIKCAPEDFDAAEALLPEDLKSAIRHCVKNVKTFHGEQMRRVHDEGDWMMEVEGGVWAGERVNAIPSVGLYVPRGKGAFPSALYMLAVPAVLAGVETIAVVTPPTPDGADEKTSINNADAATLYTAKLCGIKNVYKCGGAQAIAALAHGTDSVPKVTKVLGPGSPYVAAAKRALSHIMDPGMPAGPSDGIVLADGSADPYNTCLDVLNEAEHGKDSAVLLITHDAELAAYVRDNLADAIAELPQPHREICEYVFNPDQGYGGIVLTDSLEASIALSNDYAPEHLHLKIENPDEAIPKLTDAGEILIGEMTPSTLGNYGTGVNHVLPTGGWAKTQSCTSVWDFLKRTSVSKVDAQGFETLKHPVTTLTDYENFPAHGDVIRKRNL
jgi:histidinol dehydrogenase